jgi:hypothetical protein
VGSTPIRSCQFEPFHLSFIFLAPFSPYIILFLIPQHQFAK